MAKLDAYIVNAVGADVAQSDVILDATSSDVDVSDVAVDDDVTAVGDVIAQCAVATLDDIAAAAI